MKINGVNFEVLNGSRLITNKVNFEPIGSILGNYEATAIVFDKYILHPGESAFAVVDCIIRSNSFPQPTILELVGLSSFANAFTYFEVYGINSSGTRLIQGIHDENSIDSTIEFDTPVDVHVDGFEIFLPDAPPYYLGGNIWYSDEGMGALEIPIDAYSESLGITRPVSVYTSHVDTALFDLTHHDIGVEGPPRHEFHFDLGFIPSFDPDKRVMFGVRGYCSVAGSSWAYVYSEDNITWSRPDGSRHDFPLADTWYTTEWDIGSASINKRYFGLRGFVHPRTLHIAYLYLRNVYPGVVGYLSWSSSQIWNLSLTSGLFTFGVSYE